MRRMAWLALRVPRVLSLVLQVPLVRRVRLLVLLVHLEQDQYHNGASGPAGNASGRGTGTTPKTNAPTGTSASALTSAASPGSRSLLAGPFPPANAEGVLQITPAVLQQLLASAVAASSSNHREPPMPKFWESEPAAWFQVFRGHYQPWNLSQLALFNVLLPLVPDSAIALCRPFVGSAAPDVFDIFASSVYFSRGLR